MVISDALSRAYLEDQKPEISDAEMNYMISQVCLSVMSSLNNSRLKHQRMKL